MGEIYASVLWQPAATAQDRWDGRGLDVGFRADMLGQKIGVFAQPVARSLDLEDDGVMQQAVEQRGGDDRIAKDVASFREAAV